MSDEMDILFEHRLRSAFHAAGLPPAPATLRDVLDDLPRTAARPRRSVPRWAAMGALAAGFAVVAFVAWGAIFGQGGFGPGGEATPTPTASPSPSSSPSPSPTSSPVTVYSVPQLLEGRADGSIVGGPVDLWGFYSDLRGWPADACPTPALTALELSCLDRRQGLVEGLVEAEAFVGTVVDGRWMPTSDPVVHPFWPLTLRDNPRMVEFFSVAPPDPFSPKPIFVLLTGHFDDPLAADCPTDASPPCTDRFVVDDIIQFDDPYATPTPAPSGTPFPFDSPPPPPSWMDNCTRPRAEPGNEPGDPVDPGYASAGWILKSEIPFEFFGTEVLQEVVYYAVIDGDFPVSDWSQPVTGTDEDFRWWGQAVCIADENGIFYTWVPGSTYRLYRDGHRVDGGDPHDPLPSPTPAP